MHELIKIFGMLAFFSLLLTGATGLLIFKFHVKKVSMKWHTSAAIATLVFAVTHVALIVLH